VSDEDKKELKDLLHRLYFRCLEATNAYNRAVMEEKKWRDEKENVLALYKKLTRGEI
jgi:hypothetical protein